MKIKKSGRTSSSPPSQTKVGRVIGPLRQPDENQREAVLTALYYCCVGADFCWAEGSRRKRQLRQTREDSVTQQETSSSSRGRPDSAPRHAKTVRASNTNTAAPPCLVSSLDEVQRVQRCCGHYPGCGPSHQVLQGAGTLVVLRIFSFREELCHRCHDTMSERYFGHGTAAAAALAGW